MKTWMLSLAALLATAALGAPNAHITAIRTYRDGKYITAFTLSKPPSLSRLFPLEETPDRFKVCYQNHATGVKTILDKMAAEYNKQGRDGQWSDTIVLTSFTVRNEVISARAVERVWDFDRGRLETRNHQFKIPPCAKGPKLKGYR